MAFIFISIFSFALSNCLWVRPLKQFGFLEIIIARSFFTSILFWILFVMSEVGLVPELYTKPAKSMALTLLYALLLCVFSFFGLYFHVKSLKAEKVGVAVPVSSISSFFGVATAILFLSEHVQFTFYTSLLAVFIGVLLVNNKPLKSFRFTKGVLYNLQAAFFWGVSFALFSIPAKTLGVFLFSAVLETTVCACSIVLLRTENKKWSFSALQIDNNILTLALLGFAGVIFYNLSFLYLPVSTISLLCIITPALSVVFASLLFRERLKLWQYAGIAVILSALLLLQF